MKKTDNKADVGIIVGRFMVHELHEAHIELINFVRENHGKVIVFLGLSPLRNTINNPLDFRARRQMFQEHFSDVEVYYIDDHPSDEQWSKNLDYQISKFTNPNQSVILYGGRDSFIKVYNGKHKTAELESKTFVSGTEIRRQISISYKPNKDYRAGMIAATASRFPTAYQTVDIIIIRPGQPEYEYLLVRKPEEKLWRFVGGFSDPNSLSLEDDAKREVMEETGVEVSKPVYIGSCKVNDWRYRGEKDCIKTALFVCEYLHGTPQGSDDVAEAKWFKFSEVEQNLISGHKPLFQMYLTNQ